MIKSITNFLIIFFIFQQLKSQISQIYQNGYNAFCDETLQMLLVFLTGMFDTICKKLSNIQMNQFLFPNAITGQINCMCVWGVGGR